MNEERIKAFADHADRYAYSISDDDPSVNWYKVRDEKFAELIVQEVFTVIENEQYEIYEPVIQKVKQHFGVES